MPITFTQTDTTTDCEITACSSGTLTANPIRSQIEEGGTAGTTEQVFDIAPGATELIALFQSPGLGFDEWTSGTWTVNLNITTAENDMTVENIWICRVDDTCGSVDTIADTNFSRDISAGGTFSFDLAGSASSGFSDTDTAYVLVECANGHGHTTRSVGMTPSEDITAPLGVTTQTGTTSQSVVATSSVTGTEVFVDVTTDAQTSVSATSATLNGTVDWQDTSVDVWFEWGEVGAGFPNSTTVQTINTTGTQQFSDTVTLSENTQYEFRAQADMGGTTDTGSTVSFWSLLSVTATVDVDGTTASGYQVFVTRVDPTGPSATLLSTPTTDTNGEISVEVDAQGQDVHVSAQHDDGSTTYAGRSQPYVGGT